MSQETPDTLRAGWPEASGLPHIVRTLGFAVDPAKLGLATVALIATLAFGALLDAAWTAGGGVGEDAIGEMTSTSRFDLPYEEPHGEFGIFQVWRDHEKRCVTGVLGLSWLEPAARRADLARGRRGANTLGTRAGAVAGMWHGVWWMFRYHTCFFLVFGAGSLLIWSVAGGAICRMTAVQFTRDEKLTITASVAFVRRNLLGGFYLAPCIPLGFALLVSLLLLLGGVLLRLPVLGDLASGIAFLLAILGGFIIAALLVGLAVGGSLLWPAVATEGSDAFDAFSRSMSFAFSKKSVLYGVMAVVYAAVCWSIVRWFTILGLSVTHTIVGFGTSPFGWWSRGADGKPLSKLALLWPGDAQGSVHAWPDWSHLASYEYISAALIGLAVLLVAVMVWSFLASFYFCGSTIVYLLLRRDVDGTDLGDCSVEEVPEQDVGGQGAAIRAPAPEVKMPILSPTDATTSAPTDPTLRDSTSKETPELPSEPTAKGEAEPAPKLKPEPDSDAPEHPSE